MSAIRAMSVRRVPGTDPAWWEDSKGNYHASKEAAEAADASRKKPKPKEK